MYSTHLPRLSPLALPRIARAAVVLALLGTGIATASAHLCRVATTGNDGNDGNAWSAPMDLQAALGDSSCSEIWVEKGVYKPGTSQSDTFTIRAGLQVFGGFAGNETTRSQRDVAANPTVLSGDIDNNDAVNTHGVTKTPDDISGNNSTHVVTMNGRSTPIGSDTVLDGFIITAGNTDGDGGGLLCRATLSDDAHCSPSLRHLVFRANRAKDGGAAYLDGSVGASSTPTLTDIAFINNHATARGGAVYNSGYSGGNSSPQIERATFSNNHANVAGGAIFNGGYANGDSSPTIGNATFVDNTAKYGGAIAAAGQSGGHLNAILTNVTFHGNHGDFQGNALYYDCDDGSCNPAIRNAIIWDATLSFESEIVPNAANVSIRRAIVQGGCPAGVNCQAVMLADPRLGPLQDNGGFTDTMLPDAWSAAIDAVICAKAPFHDQRGAPRPDPLSAGLLVRCDLGAVEADASPSDGIFADGFGPPPLRK